jgi:hypothetical protein
VKHKATDNLQIDQERWHKRTGRMDETMFFELAPRCYHRERTWNNGKEGTNEKVSQVRTLSAVA